jgi:putative acetyltransferase
VLQRRADMPTLRERFSDLERLIRTRRDSCPDAAQRHALNNALAVAAAYRGMLDGPADDALVAEALDAERCLCERCRTLGFAVAQRGPGCGSFSCPVNAMELRPITAVDVPQAVELVRRTLAEFGLTFGEGSATDRQLHGLPGSYRDEGGEFFVAVEEGRVLGTAGVARLGPSLYEVRKMYLEPEARGRGLGQQLLDACLAFCRAAGAKTVVLDTKHEMTRAIAFYERNGFVRDDAQIRGARCSRGYRLDL